MRTKKARDRVLGEFCGITKLAHKHAIKGLSPKICHSDDKTVCLVRYFFVLVVDALGHDVRQAATRCDGPLKNGMVQNT